LFDIPWNKKIVHYYAVVFIIEEKAALKTFRKVKLQVKLTFVVLCLGKHFLGMWTLKRPNKSLDSKLTH